MRTLLFAVAGVLLVAGCGSKQEPAAQQPEPGLQGREFVAEAVSEQGRPKAMVDGTQVSIDFTDDGRILARAGCNTISGPVSTDNGRLSTSGLAITEMGCDRAKHEQDSWLVGVLQSGPAWQFDGTKLRLTGQDTEIVLVPKQDLPLTGTRWHLDTVTTGGLAQSSDGTATLVFDQDKVQITTECNSGRATYRMAGDKIVFEGTGLTRKACPDELMQAEQAIVPVLDGEVSFRIHNETLELTHPSGNGLRLRGQR